MNEFTHTKNHSQAICQRTNVAFAKLPISNELMDFNSNVNALTANIFLHQ